MDVSENFDRRLKVFYQHWLSTEYLCHFNDELKHLLLLNVEGSHDWNGSLALPWRQ